MLKIIKSSELSAPIASEVNRNEVVRFLTLRAKVVFTQLRKAFNKVLIF